MRLLFIIVESNVEERVEEVLVEAGAGFTRFTGGTGRGRSGPREGTPVWPGLNTLLMAGVPDEAVNGLVSRLEAISEHRAGRLALKVYSVPVEEFS